MTPEEITAMQEENRRLKALATELLPLREVVAELLPLRELVTQQALLIAQLQQQVQALQERVDKNSHNSHLPPSSDRFVRRPGACARKAGSNPADNPVTRARRCAGKPAPMKWWCIR